nr:hypothetical protein OH820_13370 [Streptomyces sp. NBC_00857]
MDVPTAIVTAVSLVVGKACAVLALWLRWRIRRVECLAAVVRAVDGAERIEVDDQRGLQQRLRITLVGAPPEHGRPV